MSKQQLKAKLIEKYLANELSLLELNNQGVTLQDVANYKDQSPTIKMDNQAHRPSNN
ncbi:hypothetical protein H5S40_04240 [Limosilactobacillus sp. RRLNB_1_1]|uniref:Uncharacterized protein n=1 Tax=Limosilactobacillus albertensis TaxID=2759752 RepID=A0A7W3TR43_9LACO|nr:hypothetical protein [Limosilactobacillus albertensis]MBB1069365.1 hypothetical protein [Limosilactobacillus albertensis]MCD7118603.1 hypothetical protein [Limosilactobacillus albertensis]MCD7128352.1 hypothetical protein [Limosilactobacillus albertensis]